MTTTISGTSGVTFPAGGTGNPAGAVVGTTDTQTLTNKTLTAPAISSAVMTTMASSVITSGSPATTTSGTTVDFASIPSWVKRITVTFSGVSLNGTNKLLLRLGYGATPTYQATGYASVYGALGAATGSSTTDFTLTDTGTASYTSSGVATISLLDTNQWAMTSTLGETTIPYLFVSTGAVTLSGTLTAVRVLTNGANTFDAGKINILYE